MALYRCHSGKGQIVRYSEGLEDEKRAGSTLVILRIESQINRTPSVQDCYKPENGEHRCPCRTRVSREGKPSKRGTVRLCPYHEMRWPQWGQKEASRSIYPPQLGQTVICSRLPSPANCLGRVNNQSGKKTIHKNRTPAAQANALPGDLPLLLAS